MCIPDRRVFTTFIGASTHTQRTCDEAFNQVSGEVLHAEVQCVDGSHIRGALLLHSVPFQTTYARIALELRFVTELSFTPAGDAAVTMTNGDRLQGTIQVESLAVETLMGTMVIPLKMVKALYLFPSDGTLVKGLVAYYPLNDGAEDLSGNNNNGLVHGTVPVPDRFGREARALRFDGSSYLQVPDNPSLSARMMERLCGFISTENLKAHSK